MYIHRRCRRPWWFAWLVCGLVSGVIHGAVAASEGPPPTLNPKDYSSPSAKYSLAVKPSDLYGRGKATYRLTRDGHEVWSAEKPYTLWEARVTDDGTVAGYAYSNGWRGFAEAGYSAGLGDFRVVILDPRGKERLDLATKRGESRYLHTPPNPLAAGLIVDAANDRVVVRVSDVDVNRQAEAWWVYQLSTGQRVAMFRPKELMPNPEPVRYVMSAKPVMGTPLTVLHWWRFHWEKERKHGARFTLIGQDGKTVWSLDLADDYEAGGDEAAAEQLQASVGRTGGILGSDQVERFELRFAKEGQRVTFAVARAANGTWKVSEVARHPFVETATPTAKPAEIPLLALRPTERIVLKSPHARPIPDIRDVGDFVFDPGGSIAFLRRSEGKPPALVVVDQQGKVLHTIALDPAHAENGAGWSGLTCVGAGRYLLIRDNPNDPNTMHAAVADIATGKAALIPGFSTTVLSKVAGFPDGRFVVKGGLAPFRGGVTSDNSLRAFDSQGKRLWSLPENRRPDDPASLFSPSDLTVTTTGMIAVVNIIRKSVQFFDRGGNYHHTVDLKKAWGREPRYPSGLAADRDGGVVVDDSQNDPPYVRMSADGTVRAEVRPRLKDGRTFRLSHIQVAPDGALWISDGHALYRLGESGNVDRVLGDAPDPQTLDQAAAVTRDMKGRIYAVAGRTGAIHVFEPDGRWLRVCVPGLGDVPAELSLPHLTVADSGDIYLGLGMLGSNRSLHFSPEGQRVGIETSKLDEISETWYAQPKTGRRWVLGYEKVYLIDGKGTLIRTITRRADGLWLEHPEAASVAADGSIAIVSRGQDRRDDDAIAVSLYSPRGDPIRTFTLPRTIAWSFPRIAYDGKRVAVADAKAIVLFDASGKAVGQFNPAPDRDVWWTPFLPPDGRGLLLFDGVNTLHRFALP